MLYTVFFDGTSYVVADEYDSFSDCEEVMLETEDCDEAFDYCEILNESC